MGILKGLETFEHRPMGVRHETRRLGVEATTHCAGSDNNVAGKAGCVNTRSGSDIGSDTTAASTVHEDWRDARVDCGCPETPDLAQSSCMGASASGEGDNAVRLRRGRLEILMLLCVSSQSARNKVLS
mmetsp:Transcript_93127/g.262994  ORF Transcript_93127/g.262994 Transcript_93127/m.262994 type:complete len:128 (-) Transcript_93127:481-864(-)